MSKNKQVSKIVLVKQWLKQRTYKNGTLSFFNCLKLIADIQGIIGAFKVVITVLGFVLGVLYKVLPFLIEVCNFLENLASSLSYKRRRFFYGFY